MNILKVFVFLTFLSTQAFAAHISVSLDPSKKFLKINTGDKTKQLPLGLPTGFQVEGSPQFIGDETYGLVLVLANEATVGTTIVHAIDGKGKKLWSLDLQAFNPSTPLIEKDFVYLAGIGRIFKVDKKTGKVLWTHDGLFENEKYKFNGAEAIVRSDKQIIFSSKLHVNDENGKIIEGSL